MNIEYIEPIKRWIKVPSPVLHVYADTHYCLSNLERGAPRMWLKQKVGGTKGLDVYVLT